MSKILLVDDDIPLAQQVGRWLKSEQHLVEHVGTGTEALERLAMYPYDLVLLDIGLPDMRGTQVLKTYRERGGKVYVMMLTGEREMSDKLEALDGGADDYLTKPFDVRELSSRIRALARRPTEVAASILKCKDIELDEAAMRVTVGGDLVDLKPKEFQLLAYFLKHLNQVVTMETLLSAVWTAEQDASSETIYTHIKTLRKKLTRDGVEPPLRTVHRLGYTLEG